MLFLPWALRPAQTRKHCFRNILSQCWSKCCMGEQTGKKQKLGRKFCVFKIYCLGTQTRKRSGNIRSQCFFGVSNDSSFALTSSICRRHEICVLKVENHFEIFRKHFLCPVRNFASATMFPPLRRPLVCLDYNRRQ